MTAPARHVQDQHWADVTAAVDAAVRELPSRLMHLDPRLQDARTREGSTRSGATGAGLVLGGDWSAPARAREATNAACTEAGLHPAVAAAASVVALRTVSSAVAAGAETLTVKANAGGAGVYVSLRASFPAPPDLDGQRGTAAARATPWVLGGSARRAGVGRHEQGTARLFGVAVDAHGVLQDRSDVIVWFEMRRTAATPPTGPGVGR